MGSVFSKFLMTVGELCEIHLFLTVYFQIVCNRFLIIIGFVVPHPHQQYNG